jgi:hypothetical protein
VGDFEESSSEHPTHAVAVEPGWRIEDWFRPGRWSWSLSGHISVPSSRAQLDLTSAHRSIAGMVVGLIESAADIDRSLSISAEAEREADG